MVIAENNKLNQIDQGIQYTMKQEQRKLRKQGFQAEFPPFFRDRDQSDSETNPEQSQSHQN